MSRFDPNYAARIRQANDHAENCERLLRKAEARIRELEAERDEAQAKADYHHGLVANQHTRLEAADRLAEAVEQQVAPGSFAGRALAAYRGEDTDD